MSEVHTWNVSAASNNSAPPDGAPENMNYSAVNDTIREIMASVKRFQADISGSLTTGGTANAITISPNVTYASYFAGMRISFTAGLTNTGATTLNVGGLGVSELRGYDNVALSGGEIVAGRIYDVVYTGSRWNMANPELALGSLATKNTVNNGDWSGTDLAVINGGTGASTASGALTNLGVSAFMQTVLDDANAAAARATLGVGTGDGDMVGANNLSDIANATTARINLGLGNLSVLNVVNNTTWSGTDLSVANGGTGSSTASGARSNLGAYGANDAVTFTTGNFTTSLGVGVASPSAAFEVNGQARVNGGSSTTPSFSFRTDTDVGLFLATTNALGFTTASAERMRIDASGNLGVGTTSPSGTLHISETGKAGTGAPALYIGPMSAATESDISLHGNAVIGTESSVTHTFESGGFIRFGQATASETGTVGFTEILRIDTDSVDIDVNDVIVSGSAPRIRLNETTNSAWWLIADGGAFTIRDDNATQPLTIIEGAPTGSFYITADGDVGISSTTPDAKFEVMGANDGDDQTSRTAVFRHPSTNMGAIEIRNGRDDGALANRYSSIQSWSNELSNAVDLILQPSGGDIGLGTTSPSFTYGGGLEIQQAGDTTLRLERTGATASAVEISARSGAVEFDVRTSSVLAFSTAATERMRIAASGNVGIANTNPLAELDVDGATRTYAEVNASVSGILVPATHLKGAVNQLSGNITMPTASGGAHATFSADGSARTISRGGSLTMYVNGVNSSSATLSARGVAGVVFTTANICYLTGDVS